MSAPSPEFLTPAPPAPPAPRGSRFWLWFSLPWLLIALVVQILRCDLPPWYEPSAFKVTSSDSRPHPSVPGVLLISASFRNDAQFPQAWPQLELSLSNLDDQSLGLRRFTRDQYLGESPGSTLIAPGQSASITLEVLDPGKRAVTFKFEFR